MVVSSSRARARAQGALGGSLAGSSGALACACACLAVLALTSCGAKTGLLVPDASREPDGGLDAGTDAGMCRPEPLVLVRRGAQVVFVIDRSNSMRDTMDGRQPEPDEPRRWDVLADTLGEVLRDADPLLEIGAKFYPRWTDEPPTTAEEACTTSPGMDLVPARNNHGALLRLFTTTQPRGGTPTAVALSEVRDYLSRQLSPGVPRFVILATDGGPNCNPDTGVHHSRCLCTGRPADCSDSPTFGPYNCIDEDRAVAATRSLFEGLGVPVYVIGMDDPTRPDLADVMDRMAVAGGRPREVPGERQFYSVRRTADLQGALETITDSISRCVFALSPPPLTAVLELTLDGVSVPHDLLRSEGWDFTRTDRSEITLFGDACERASRSDGQVVAEITCPATEN